MSKRNDARHRAVKSEDAEIEISGFLNLGSAEAQETGTPNRRSPRLFLWVLFVLFQFH